jgi:hypothetical protein
MRRMLAAAAALGAGAAGCPKPGGDADAGNARDAGAPDRDGAATTNAVGADADAFDDARDAGLDGADGDANAWDAADASDARDAARRDGKAWVQPKQRYEVVDMLPPPARDDLRTLPIPTERKDPKLP